MKSYLLSSIRIDFLLRENEKKKVLKARLTAKNPKNNYRFVGKEISIWEVIK
jgi:hypothetical protein